MARRMTTSMVVAVLVALAVGGPAAEAGSARLLVRAKMPAALAPLPGGGLAYANAHAIYVVTAASAH